MTQFFGQERLRSAIAMRKSPTTYISPRRQPWENLRSSLDSILDENVLLGHIDASQAVNEIKAAHRRRQLEPPLNYQQARNVLWLEAGYVALERQLEIGFDAPPDKGRQFKHEPAVVALQQLVQFADAKPRP